MDKDSCNNKNPPKEKESLNSETGNTIENPFSDQENEQEEEEFSEDFQCCVCLELLYKPIVLACGHISCFWCVLKAMNFWHESRCPICRHPYNHFPNVCQLLHCLLLKMYPVAYKRRENKVGEEEKEAENFSPQLNLHMFGSHPSNESDAQTNALESPTHSLTKLHSESCFSTEMQSTIGNSSIPSLHGNDYTKLMPSTSSMSGEGSANIATEKCNLSAKELENRTKNQVSFADLLCAQCKKLLFRPVVLNCGHVYCETCIIIPQEGDPRCPICQSLHPNGVPSVCLVLEKFLQEQCPQMYSERLKGFGQKSRGSVQAQRPAKHSSRGFSQVNASWLFGNGPKVHVAVGCDSCGMFPIIGERYRCKDCVEKVGFDLCESCYKSPSKILGRFNQQHKPDHNFEIADLGLSDEEDPNQGDFPIAPTLAGDVPENLDNVSNDVEDVAPNQQVESGAPSSSDDWHLC